ncbi:hypothetical protein BH09PAT3_BH09PAT3_4540 [soil metagenome]
MPKNGNNIYLVNPGQHDHFFGNLTPRGVDESVHAGAVIAGKETKLVVISATDERTSETADLVADQCDTKAIKTELVDAISDHIERIGGDLEQYVGRVLHSEGVAVDEDTAVVMVTHASVLAAAKGYDQMALATGAVTSGEVVVFDAEQWHERAGFAGQSALRQSELVAV